MSMTSPNDQSFAHLHVHTEYSLLDGAIRINDLIKKVKDYGHSAVAMTDHCNMFGAVEFYSKCKEAGIKPIIGTEIFWQGNSACSPSKESKNDISTTNRAIADSRGEPKKGADQADEAFHLVLLARSNEGYKNLCRIVSSGYLDSAQNETPVVKREFIEKHGEGIIALSSCLKGEFAYLVAQLRANISDANIIQELERASSSHIELIVTAIKKHVANMEKSFGKNGYYIELIDNNLRAQKKILDDLVAVAQFCNLPLVATADAHYLEKSDSEAHAVLTGVKNDLTMSDLRGRNTQAQFHLLNNEEMVDKFSRYPEALENQSVIANQCNVELTFGTYFLPQFETSGNESIDDALVRFSEEGLRDRLSHLRKLYGSELDEDKEKTYWDRLKYELDVIIKMGFPGYFLIVQDFINWAKDNDIPVGPGRGSGAGSLVAYALRITDLDPLRFNLIFERFLNPERVSMPDFDVDFCQDRRDEVIQYVTRKYGHDNVAQITTFGKMKAKAALRDVGRVLELGYSRVDKIAKLIPNELDIKLQEALDKEPRILEEAKRDERIENMIHLALKLEGMNRHTSVHAAGVVISEGGMDNYVPVYKSEDGALITQYEMKNAEKVGLVKFDFLGLKTLTVIKKAVDLINQSKDPDFNIDEIDLEKKCVYDLISSAHSVGIFQLESSGMQALLKKLKPSRFEDIIAVVALFRPGPLGSGMVDDFIERKHGRQEIQYSHPSLSSILADTYGIILYQEQVQKIAATLASYSLGEADLLRRAMGKKKPEEMAKQKVRFISGCRENKVEEAIAEELFELMAKFAAYGFNKSHSAAYGLVSYQTAYLKAHYPEEFMAAIMTCDLDNTDKLVRYVEECRRMKFTLYPPDINRSSLEFDVPGKRSIGYGLAAIKGLGSGSIQPILEEREANGPYSSLTDLASRVNLTKVGKKTLELLVQAGALDSFSSSRAAIHGAIPEMVRYSESHHQAKSSGQRLLFASDDVETNAVDIASWETKLNHQENSETKIDWLFKEKKMLGVFITGHPLGEFNTDCKRFGRLKIKDIPQNVGKKKIPLVALLNASSERFTKSNKKMAYINLEDESGAVEAVMFEREMVQEIPPSNTIVVAYLSINKSFDGSSINTRIESIQPLEEVRRELIQQAEINLKADSLALKQSDNALKHKIACIRQLQGLLGSHPGDTSISFSIDFGDAVVKLKNTVIQVELSNHVCEIINGYENEGLTLNY